MAGQAMMNGVPVLGSNRGALRDTIGRSGFVLSVSEITAVKPAIPEQLL
jgi:glycosyltransferase involved in cell wall biosynthesis